jgi:hypothetical protein
MSLHKHNDSVIMISNSAVLVMYATEANSVSVCLDGSSAYSALLMHFVCDQPTCYISKCAGLKHHAHVFDAVVCQCTY